MSIFSMYIKSLEPVEVHSYSRLEDDEVVDATVVYNAKSVASIDRKQALVKAGQPYDIVLPALRNMHRDMKYHPMITDEFLIEVEEFRREGLKKLKQAKEMGQGYPRP